MKSGTTVVDGDEIRDLRTEGRDGMLKGKDKSSLSFGLASSPYSLDIRETLEYNS
jgi:hypothetical protein